MFREPLEPLKSVLLPSEIGLPSGQEELFIRQVETLRGNVIRSPHFDSLLVFGNTQRDGRNFKFIGSLPQTARDDCQCGSGDQCANGSQGQDSLVVSLRPDHEEGKIIVIGTLAMLLIFPSAACLGYWLASR
jgi:hypothetical protein